MTGNTLHILMYIKIIHKIVDKDKKIKCIRCSNISFLNIWDLKKF